MLEQELDRGSLEEVQALAKAKLVVEVEKEWKQEEVAKLTEVLKVDNLQLKRGSQSLAKGIL